MIASKFGEVSRHRPALLSLDGNFAGALVAIIEVTAITVMATMASAVWHILAYGAPNKIRLFFDIGLVTGVIYTLPFLLGGDYRADNFLARRRSVARIINVWIFSFFVLATLAFLTQSTGTASRGSLVLFFALGLITVLSSDLTLRAALRGLVMKSIVAPRRLLVIGSRSGIADFTAQHPAKETGVVVAATVILPIENERETGFIDESIRWALEHARSIHINDVLILLEDTEKPDLRTYIADRFMDLPVVVHLGQVAIAAKFPGLHVARIGRAQTLALCKAPLNATHRLFKRMFDIVLATVGLVLLSPFFVAIACLIRLETPGPAFFRQRRRGFNQREFLIWKFRTMTTMEDGAEIKQAVANDPRVTRLGRILRRFNIDELPQLINVIVGDMSLVGPRPHALAHDKYYERVILRYARRLNVKPGITGWAQVNGYRGLTETEHAMRSRIAHDLYYIDNWSIALDIYILILTVLSPKAFRNAV